MPGVRDMPDTARTLGILQVKCYRWVLPLLLYLTLRIQRFTRKCPTSHRAYSFRKNQTATSKERQNGERESSFSVGSILTEHLVEQALSCTSRETPRLYCVVPKLTGI